MASGESAMGQHAAYFELVEGLAGDPPAGLESVVVMAEVGSTNGLARRAANEMVGQGIDVLPTLFLADCQTAGRGRQGRTWQSPAGLGLYATLLWPLAPGFELAKLPLLTGTALAQSLNGVLDGGPVRLKWPNDLVVGAAKLGGILLEVLPAGEHQGVALIGFGINLEHRREELPLPGATSLRLLGERRLPARSALVRDLTIRLFLALRSGEDLATVLANYAALSIHRPGDALRCRLGGETLCGTFVGFDARGFLRLLVGGEERMISAGEVVD